MPVGRAPQAVRPSLLSTTGRAIHPPTPAAPGRIIRRPTVADGRTIWDLARRSGSLDLNSPYAYLLLCHHFADTASVAEVDGRLAGFVVGYRPPPTPDTVFVWQIAVDADHRGAGLGLALLRDLADRTTSEGVRHLEATVTASNTASTRLFRAFAQASGAELTVSPLFAADDFPGDDHEAEELFRIGPLTGHPPQHR